MSRVEDLPLRPCVGLTVFNRTGRVFVGRRSEGPEHIDEIHVWQMPQGGIDPGEDPWPAALRELYEETSIRSIERLGAIDEWLSYDIPRDIVGRAWGGKYRGQTSEVVCLAIYRRGRRNKHFLARRRRPSARIHRVDVGGNGEPARSRGPVQTTGL